jgi:hypothetical protein
LRRSTVAACWTMVTSRALACVFAAASSSRAVPNSVFSPSRSSTACERTWSGLRQNLNGHAEAEGEIDRAEGGEAGGGRGRRGRIARVWTDPRGRRLAGSRARPGGRGGEAPGLTCACSAASAAYRCSMAWAMCSALMASASACARTFASCVSRDTTLASIEPGAAAVAISGREGRVLPPRGAANNANIVLSLVAPFEVCLADFQVVRSLELRRALPPAPTHSLGLAQASARTRARRRRPARLPRHPPAALLARGRAFAFVRPPPRVGFGSPRASPS